MAGSTFIRNVLSGRYATAWFPSVSRAIQNLLRASLEQRTAAPSVPPAKLSISSLCQWLPLHLRCQQRVLHQQLLHELLRFHQRTSQWSHHELSLQRTLRKSSLQEQLLRGLPRELLCGLPLLRQRLLQNARLQLPDLRKSSLQELKETGRENV